MQTAVEAALGGHAICSAMLWKMHQAVRQHAGMTGAAASQTVVEAALAAARATAEAEEAAACATRLSEAADHYEREAEAEQRDAPDQGPPGVHPGSPSGLRQSPHAEAQASARPRSRLLSLHGWSAGGLASNPFCHVGLASSYGTLCWSLPIYKLSGSRGRLAVTDGSGTTAAAVSGTLAGRRGLTHGLQRA